MPWLASLRVWHPRPPDLRKRTSRHYHMQQREHEDTVEKKALLTFISSTTRAPSRKNENQVLATGRVGIMRRITRACLMRTKVHSARVLCRLNGDRTQVASAFPNENAKKESLAQNQHQPGDERPMSHHHQHPPFRPLFPPPSGLPGDLPQAPTRNVRDTRLPPKINKKTPPRDPELRPHRVDHNSFLFGIRRVALIKRSFIVSPVSEDQTCARNTPKPR